MSGSWEGIGEALEQANRDWDVHLMPDMIAEMIDIISRRYAEHPSRPFEELLEAVVGDVRFDIDKFSHEWHAAKQTVGTVFSARRRKRHKYNFTHVGD